MARGGVGVRPSAVSLAAPEHTPSLSELLSFKVGYISSWPLLVIGYYDITTASGQQQLLLDPAYSLTFTAFSKIVQCVSYISGICAPAEVRKRFGASHLPHRAVFIRALQCVAVCCTAVQLGAMSTGQSSSVRCSVLQCVALRCNWVQCPRCYCQFQNIGRTRGKCKNRIMTLFSRESASQNSDPIAADFVLDV